MIPSNPSMNVQALRAQAKAEGRVAIWDIPAKKWRLVYGPDAREMIKADTGSLEGPEPEVPPLAPPPDPLAELKALDAESLFKLAAEFRLQKAAKLSRDELIAAIAKAQVEAATAPGGS